MKLFHGGLLLLLVLGPILFANGNPTKPDEVLVPPDQTTDLDTSNGPIKKSARTKRDILIFTDTTTTDVDHAITCRRPLRNCFNRCPETICGCNEECLYCRPNCDYKLDNYYD